MPSDLTPVPARDGPSCCIPLTREALSDEDAWRLAQVFKALADPARIRLISMIGAHDGGEACVCELIEKFSLSPATISHHLKVLREAGLITSDRRGTWIYYRLVPAALADLAGLFTTDYAGALPGVAG
ncbi:MAG TPA: metalloregulator ArsR/SmtB family transcription factor [Streptosporangiaceae bacterium]|nr:metalloregulator ArsR/SmtB family transcription factor [Streptosporangiaceae bacterium]